MRVPRAPPRWPRWHALLLLAMLHVPGSAESVCGAAPTSRGTQSWAFQLIAWYRCLHDNCEDAGWCTSQTDTCDAPLAGSVIAAGVAGPMSMYVVVSQFCPRMCGKCTAGKQAAAVARLGTPCPPGWNYSSGACFQLTVGKDAVDWDEAEAACESVGANLAVLDTAAQSHLAFELLVRGRLFVSTRAWVGLRAAPACVDNQSVWGWEPAGRLLGFSSWAADADARACPTTGARMCGRLCNLDFQWEAAPCEGKEQAWLCSKPAAFRDISVGTCKDYGLAAITDLATCEAAATSLGLAPALGMFTDSTGLPEGCWWSDFGQGYLLLSLNPANRGSGVEAGGGAATRVLCGQGSNRSASTAPPQPLPRGGDSQYVAVLPTQAPETKRAKLALAMCLLAYGCIFLVLLLRRRAIYAATVGGLMRVLSGDARPRPPFGCARPRRRSPLELALDAKRRACAVSAGTLHVLWDAIELGGLSVYGTFDCKGIDDLDHTKFAVVYLARIVFLLAFLTAQQRCPRVLQGVWHVHTMVAAITGLRLLQTALGREQELLLSNRSYYELLWRVPLGACMRPWPMVLLQGMYSLALILVYGLTIPGQMVVVQAASRGQLLLPRRCIQLAGVADLEDTMAQVTRVSGVIDPIYRSSLGTFVSVLGDLRGQTTSLLSFALTEAITFAVVMVCLGLLHSLLEGEAISALKLRGSESLQHAVSGMLAKLCDAVVHLDADFNVLPPARRFAALLHRSSQQEPSGRRPLFEDLVEEDRTRLTQALQAGSGDTSFLGAPNETLCVTFRDAFRVKVPCQIFHAKFTLEDGTSSYVLGINEIGERGTALPACLDPAVGTAFRLEQFAPSQEGASQDSGGGGEPETDDEPEAHRQCDIDLATHRIAKASAPLRVLLGREAVGLHAWDVVADPEPLREWLVARAQEACLEERILEFAPVRLMLPTTRKARTSAAAYEASLSCFFPAPAKEAEPSQAAACLYSIRIQRLVRVRPEHRRSFSGTPPLPLEVVSGKHVSL